MNINPSHATSLASQAFKIGKKRPDRTKIFMEVVEKVALKRGKDVVLKDHFKDGA